MFNWLVERGHTPEAAAKNQVARIAKLSTPGVGEVTKPIREFVASGADAVLSVPDVAKYVASAPLQVAGTAGNVAAGLVNLLVGGTAATLKQALDWVTLGGIRRGVGSSIRKLLAVSHQEVAQGA